MLLRFVYSFLIYLFLPFIFILLIIPHKGKRGYGERIFELFGRYRFLKEKSNNQVVWFHTVSVGETVAATRLIKEFHEANPNIQIVVTTTTTTGMEQAIKIGDFVTHLYAPLDFPFAIKSFIKHIDPCMLIIMETELWPNWLYNCNKYGIPIVLVNARMSERSCNKYSQLGKLFYKIFGQYISLILCQNNEDTNRFKKLGVKKILVTGSLKCDLYPPEDQISLGKKLRSQFPQRKIWIAASTHEGEDDLFIEVHRKVKAIIPNALLILVPRHPQRFSSVADKIAKSKFKFGKFTENSLLHSDIDILLGDKMGVMYQLFSASDVAVMGGSFVDIGGHNPLEPASVGLPIIMGKYFYNFKEFTLKMSECGGLFIVENPDKLHLSIVDLLNNDYLRNICGEKAKNVLSRGQGATSRTLEAINLVLKDKL